MDDDVATLGYDQKPKHWYAFEAGGTGFVPDNEMEEALDELTPADDLVLYKSHLVRSHTESRKPYEVMKERRDETGFYRETYTRELDDLTTEQPDTQDLRDMEFRVEVAQGNASAGAHRTDTLPYEGLPEDVKDAFKGHDDVAWTEAS